VFDKWQNSRKPSASIPIPGSKKNAPLPPPRRRKNHDLTDWSESLLAEFNNIIAQELSQLEANHAGNMRLRITRSRSWENNDTDVSGTPPPSPVASDSSSGCSPSLHHRALGLARVLRRQRSPLFPVQSPGDAVLVKVSSLPDADVMYVTASDSDIVTHRKKDEASSTFPRSDSTCALTRHEHMARQNNSVVTQIGAFPAEDVVVSSRTETSSCMTRQTAAVQGVLSSGFRHLVYRYWIRFLGRRIGPPQGFCLLKTKQRQKTYIRSC
jgi:hypothetical protein